MNDYSRSVGSNEPATDTELYDLIEALTDQFQKGQPVDLSELSTQYPQYAERLASIVPTLQLMGSLRQQVSSEGQLAEFLSPTEMLGDFRIKREIGRGGKGIVYDAEQISLSRTVALKILPMAAVLPDRHIERFKNEARAAAALHHPHIVPVYSVGFERGVYFYTMQYIDGQTLAQFFRSETVSASKNMSDLQCQPVSSRASNVLNQSLFEIGSRDHWNKVAEFGIQIADAIE